MSIIVYYIRLIAFSTKAKPYVAIRGVTLYYLWRSGCSGGLEESGAKLGCGWNNDCCYESLKLSEIVHLLNCKRVI